tara:strand:- start:327 stop:683 length:357 start_codon:yes stop_codon:yes gene_type:complete
MSGHFHISGTLGKSQDLVSQIGLLKCLTNRWWPCFTETPTLTNQTCLGYYKTGSRTKPEHTTSVIVAWSHKKNSKKVKKVLAFYGGYDIIIVYDKEKNTNRENKRSQEKKSLDSITNL